MDRRKAIRIIAIGSVMAPEALEALADRASLTPMPSGFSGTLSVRIVRVEGTLYDWVTEDPDRPWYGDLATVRRIPGLDVGHQVTMKVGLL